MTLEITNDNFEQEVLKSSLPVLLDFWAEWCPPCKMLGPTIDELAKELAGKVKIGKLNIDHHPIIPSQFGIRSIPTMILFDQGNKVDMKVGALTKDAIINWIKDKLEIEV